MNNEMRPSPPPPATGGITPETKLEDLLNRYPRLESVLIELSPTFSKLRNPVLRKTVARVATLRQVAQVAGVPIGDLIERLRLEVGIRDISPVPQEEDEAVGETAAPSWFSPEAVVQSFDARPVLEAGGHPLSTVMQGLARLERGQVYELITPFVPAPMLSMVEEKGYKWWVHRESENVVKTYFTKG